MFNRGFLSRMLAGVFVLVVLLSLVAFLGACNDDSDDEDTAGYSQSSDESTVVNYSRGVPQGVTVAGSAYGDIGSKGSAGDIGPAGPAGSQGPPPEIVPAPTSIPVPTAYAEFEGDSWGIDRMIVRTGTLRLKVQSIQDALDEIKGVVSMMGGYVVSSGYSGQGADTATISVRVPVDRYDEATGSLRHLAIEVLLESSRTSDVTEEYTDLDSQVRNLEATETRYLELLQKAEKVDDMLKIERMISQTRGEIEQIKGRMTYLERTSSTSLIDITLVEDRPIEVVFEADTIRIEEGSKVYFSNKSTGGIGPYGYLWDFGDGNTSADRNVSVVYDDPGVYSVSLKVTDSKGSGDTLVKTDYITVVGNPGWSASDTADSAWSGLSGIGRGLASFFIWAGILFPFWVTIALFIYALNRHYGWIGKPRED